MSKTGGAAELQRKWNYTHVEYYNNLPLWLHKKWWEENKDKSFSNLLFTITDWGGHVYNVLYMGLKHPHMHVRT